MSTRGGQYAASHSDTVEVQILLRALHHPGLGAHGDVYGGGHLQVVPLECVCQFLSPTFELIRVDNSLWRACELRGRARTGREMEPQWRPLRLEQMVRVDAFYWGLLGAQWGRGRAPGCPVGLCFLSREDPLAFVGELVWWCQKNLVGNSFLLMDSTICIIMIYTVINLKIFKESTSSDKCQYLWLCSESPSGINYRVTVLWAVWCDNL